MKRFLKKAVYIFLLLFVFLNILCAVQAYHFTRFQPGAAAQNPQQMGMLDKTGAALFGVSMPKSSVIDSLHIAHTSQTIITGDGLKLAAWYAVNPGKNIQGTVILFHGHGNSRSGIIKETEMFYNMGYHTLSIDFRNHGESEGNTCSVGYNEAKDVKAAYDFAVSRGAKDIVLYGISMGAATITKAMHDYSSVRPAKIILEMPFASMHEAVQGFVRLMNLPGEPLGTLLTFWGGAELGVWAFNNKPAEYVKKINCPVLLQWGRQDIRVKESETTQIFSNLASAQKILLKYDSSGHESLCKKEHEKWMMAVSAFLKK